MTKRKKSWHVWRRRVRAVGGKEERNKRKERRRRRRVERENETEREGKNASMRNRGKERPGEQRKKESYK